LSQQCLDQLGLLYAEIQNHLFILHRASRYGISRYVFFSSFSFIFVTKRNYSLNIYIYKKTGIIHRIFLRMSLLCMSGRLGRTIFLNLGSWHWISSRSFWFPGWMPYGCRTWTGCGSHQHRNNGKVCNRIPYRHTVP